MTSIEAYLGLAGAGAGLSLAVLLLVGIFRRSREPVGLTALGILMEAIQRIAKGGRPLGRAFMAVFVLLAASTLILRHPSSPAIWSGALDLMAVLAAFTIFPPLLLNCQSITAAMARSGRVSARLITLVLYTGFYAFCVLVAGSTLLLIPFDPLRILVIALAGTALPLVTIWLARASLMIPAAAMGQSGWIRESMEWSRGSGIQLAGALWLTALAWMLVAVITWIMLPGGLNTDLTPVRRTIALVIECAGVTAYYLLSLACIAVVYHRSRNARDETNLAPESKTPPREGAALR